MKMTKDRKKLGGGTSRNTTKGIKHNNRTNHNARGTVRFHTLKLVEVQAPRIERNDVPRLQHEHNTKQVERHQSSECEEFCKYTAEPQPQEHNDMAEIVPK